MWAGITERQQRQTKRLDSRATSVLPFRATFARFGQSRL